MYNNYFSYFSASKIRLTLAVFFLARVEGIGPPLEVLETPVLPLYYTRLRSAKKTEFRRAGPQKHTLKPIPPLPNFYLNS